MESSVECDATIGEKEKSGKISENTELKFRGWTRLRISVEIPFLLVMFISSFSGNVQLNLIERNVCNVRFNKAEYDCYKTLTTEERKLVNGDTASINMIITMVTLITPLLLSLFIGPWTDKHGRKPFIVLIFVGNFLQQLLLTILSLFPTLNPYYLVLTALPQCLSGGIISLYVCAFCYVCDIFEEQYRPTRFNIIFSMNLAGQIIGNSLVYTVFQKAGHLGFPAVFFTSSVVAALGLVFLWFLPETVPPNPKESRWIFDWKFLQSTIFMVLRSPCMELCILITGITLEFAYATILAGESNVEYLIGKSEYTWTLAEFNIYAVVTMTISGLSSSLGSIAMKDWLKWENNTISLVAAVIVLIAEVLRIQSQNQVQYWITSCCMKIFTVIGPTIMAEMGSHVSPQDLGKMYSLASLLDNIAVFLSSFVYTSTYYKLIEQKHTSLQTFYVSVAFSILIIFNSLCLRYLLRKKSSKVGPYSETESSQTNETVLR